MSRTLKKAIKNMLFQGIEGTMKRILPVINLVDMYYKMIDTRVVLNKVYHKNSSFVFVPATFSRGKSRKKISYKCIK